MILRNKILLTSVQNILVYDSFNRADNLLSIGNADTGQFWQVVAGVWGILNNKVTVITTVPGGHNRVYIEAGVSDCICTAKLQKVGVSAKILFRYVDTNNHWHVSVSQNDNAYHIAKRVGGTLYPLVVGDFPPQDGDNLKVLANGSNIKFYVNDVLLFDITDNQFQTATKYGLGSYNEIIPEFDDFKVVRL